MSPAERADLESTAILYLRHAAASGWAPPDLLAALGAAAAPLIDAAAIELAPEALGAHAAEWRAGSGLPGAPAPDEGELRRLLVGIAGLYPLADRALPYPYLPTFSAGGRPAGDPRRARLAAALLSKAASTTFPAEAAALRARAARLEAPAGPGRGLARTRLRLPGRHAGGLHLIAEAALRAHGARGLLLHPAGVVAALGEPMALRRGVCLARRLAGRAAAGLALSGRCRDARFAGRYLAGFAAEAARVLAPEPGLGAAAEAAIGRHFPAARTVPGYAVSGEGWDAGRSQARGLRRALGPG